MTTTHEILALVAQSVAGALVMPLVGWLADIRFGRFKAISWSIWIMWISSMVITGSSVIAEFVDSYNDIHEKLLLFLFAIHSIGFCGFQANIVQFGVDQLHDASTTEIKSFIAWYAGSFLSGRSVIDFALACIHKYKSIGPLLISVHQTVILVTYLLFNHFLIKEPSSQNPFKLVYSVMKYAIKHKHPRQRSAFTFSEDHLPSRMDFGKNKYGGPFTTEQVEDVKTLFQSLVVAIVVTAMYGTTYSEDKFISNSMNVYRSNDDTGTSESLKTCFSNYIDFTGAYFLVAIVIIPINEILIYPIVNRCLPRRKIYATFILGALLRITKYIALLGLTSYTRYRHLMNSGPDVNNTTILCLFQADSGSLSNTIDNNWFILPQILSTISDLLLVIAMIEFFCAQVPYSMKGLVAGTSYGLLALFIALGRVLPLPFIITSLHWGTKTISCGFWYLLMKLLFLITIVTLSVAVRRYKWRKREDVLPNEQIFAERYYSKDL